MFACGAQLDRLGVTLCVEHRGLLAALRGQHRGLLLTVGASDRGFLVALRLGDGRSAVALGAHLCVHRRHDVRRRIDALDLDTHDSHTPLVGGVVEDLTQLRVDRVA